MITNSTHRAAWRKRVRKWSANAVAAKARKRRERAEAEPALALAAAHPIKPSALPRLKYLTITLRCGQERSSFRVYRYDAKRFLCRGRVQAASRIARRLQLVLEALL